MELYTQRESTALYTQYVLPFIIILVREYSAVVKFDQQAIERFSKLFLNTT